MICKFCGSIQQQDAQFCSGCGAELVKPVTENTAVSEDGNKFVERMHQYGSSTLFFVGCILFTAGTALGLVTSLRFFNFFSPIFIAWSVLPVIGVWIIYSASINPQPQERTLTALTIFKVITMIMIVLTCIGFGLAGLGGLIGLIASVASGEAFIIVTVFIVLAITIAIAALYLRFYLIALNRVITSIRDGIYTGYSREIRGAGSFTVWSYVIIGFSILGSLLSFALFGLGGFMDEFINYFNQGFAEGFYESAGIVPDFDLASFMPPFGMLSLLVSLASSVGMILLIATLGRFAESLKREPLA